MELFSNVVIERDFPEHSESIYYKHLTYGLDPEPGDLQAGLLMDSSSSEDDSQLQRRSRNKDTVEIICCEKPWKQGANFNKHWNRVHNLRYNCEHCVFAGADKKELHRHYWSSHKDWAKANNIPEQSGKCQGCGKSFTRKDRIRRHLERSPLCREKLGL
ncbi:hypothetical protein FSHL1_006177 [Fusarium sambucinum]